MGMKTWKNWIFSACLCAGIGTAAGLATSCTPQGQKADPQAADSATEENKNMVVETIMNRRSIRKYKDQPVEREKLETLIRCGINAPSGMNRQPWEVRVVDDAEYINGVTEIFKEANPKAAEEEGFKNMFRNAPAVIFIGSPKDGSGQFDCGLLGENIVLAAQSMGLGTCFLGGPVRFMLDQEEVRPYVERLQFSENYGLLYAIAVGYPDESPEAKPRDAGKARFID